ncbi:hypothetical protein GIB67_019280 [Kingdonia uniflora]|uniref:Uncharacterized protein n=1 Tax=Kingdonia uniflora TaxID=39325 RepID=A0A7J7MZY9_9MAGN|nr:hypothetical protein GIB67_019280 [Kingdonia uniflora]
MSEENRHKTSKSSSSSNGSMLNVEERGRSYRKGLKFRRGRSQSRGKSKPPGMCWTCGKKGHFRRDCNSSSSSKKIDDEVKDTMNLTEEVSSDEALLLLCGDNNESWTVNFGASFHATVNAIFLTNIVKGDFASTDTLSQSQSILNNQTLVSIGESFKLGFFSPSNSSKNRYLGIWLNKISNRTVVWVANKNHPLTNSSEILKFSENQNLALLNGTNSVIWSSSSLKLTKADDLVIAQLLHSEIDASSHWPESSILRGGLSTSVTIGDEPLVHIPNYEDTVEGGALVSTKEEILMAESIATCKLKRNMEAASYGLSSIFFLQLKCGWPYLHLTGKEQNNPCEENTDEIQKNELELPIFNFLTIAATINNFSCNNKLGEGGFVPDYKGKLVNGQEIAVKKLSKKSGQGIHKFQNEVILIAKLQHWNLVRLLGCCIQRHKTMLIYEYMPNKSLDSLIFGNGYMAPEYAIDGPFSVKLDVFSFGVLALEIVCRKKNIGFEHRDHDLNLLGHAWKLWKEGTVLKQIDTSIEDSLQTSEVLRCIHVGLLCVQQRPDYRAEHVVCGADVK